MPIKDAAKKALRQKKARTLRNNTAKDAYKQAVKAVIAALESGKEVKELVQLAQKKLDKAAEKGVIKTNTAARKLSRLMKRINKAPSQTKA